MASVGLLRYIATIACASVICASISLRAQDISGSNVISNWIEDSWGCKVWNPSPVPNESITWSGPCSNSGVADGVGTVQWFLDGKPNGSNTGVFRDGKQTGRGVAISGSGLRYEGEFLDGRPNGKGKRVFPNGNILEGEFYNGRVVGTATYTLASGQKFLVVDKDGKLVRVPGSPQTSRIPQAPPSGNQITPDPQSQVKAVYGATQNPLLFDTATSLKESQVLEGFALTISTLVAPPHSMTVMAGECKASNAFYNRQRRSLVLCYELFKEIVDGVIRDFGAGTPPETVKNIALGALLFVFLHELGHAMIHMFDIPILGREEDAADQIATFFLTASSEHKLVVEQLIGAHWFFRKKGFTYTRAHFADEHSLDEQRQFNLVCWGYGSNPEKFGGLARYAKLPQQRAVRCPREYEQMTRSVITLLRSHLRAN